MLRRAPACRERVFGYEIKRGSLTGGRFKPGACEEPETGTPRGARPGLPQADPRQVWKYGSASRLGRRQSRGRGSRQLSSCYPSLVTLSRSLHSLKAH